MAYSPIEEHGVIGNTRTIALSCTDGTIDWLCYPHFDSPSVFAAILDDEKGGYFRISPVRPDFDYKQMYWPDTNILVSRFLSSDGVSEVVDFMPISANESCPRHPVVRMAKAVRGSVRLRMECIPAFNFARDDHTVRIDGRRALFESKDLNLELLANRDLEVRDNGCFIEFTLHQEESAVFLLQEASDAGSASEFTRDQAQQMLDETTRYWQRWLAQCTYAGRWRETVNRSALMLKLLTFKPTGAIIAAPTCSLPEALGGERNWDYRYAWIRDAAFTLYALMRIGFADEAAAFMAWVEQRCGELNPDGSLQIMYGIDGRHDLTEHILDHLKG